jgi:hypothetical protein
MNHCQDLMVLSLFPAMGTELNTSFGELSREIGVDLSQQ